MSIDNYPITEAPQGLVYAQDAWFSAYKEANVRYPQTIMGMKITLLDAFLNPPDDTIFPDFGRLAQSILSPVQVDVVERVMTNVHRHKGIKIVAEGEEEEDERVAFEQRLQRLWKQNKVAALDCLQRRFSTQRLYEEPITAITDARLYECAANASIFYSDRPYLLDDSRDQVSYVKGLLEDSEGMNFAALYRSLMDRTQPLQQRVTTDSVLADFLNQYGIHPRIIDAGNYNVSRGLIKKFLTQRLKDNNADMQKFGWLGFEN